MDHRERDPLLQSDRFYPSMHLYRFLDRFRCKHLANCPSQAGAIERGYELLGFGHVSVTVAFDELHHVTPDILRTHSHDA